MSKNNVELFPLVEASTAIPMQSKPKAPILIVALCATIFILSIVVSVAPLARLASESAFATLRTNPFLLPWGSWLPSDAHLNPNPHFSILITNVIAFFILVTLSLAIYIVCAIVVQRQPPQADFTAIRRIIWFGAIVGGLIYVFTPAMLSHDIFVYIGYGRTIAIHHANPYFVAPNAFPQDPLNAYNDWRYASSAYGPVWLTICSLLAFVPGNAPLHYLIAFRLLSFASYLFNIWLVATILKKMDRSPRTVTVGTLLYAWNPLVIEESCLGAHNDTIMVTLLLLGLWFCIRAEQQNFVRPAHYLLPVIAFTLATLVKITALPLMLLFLVLLARKVLYSSTATPSLRLAHIRSLSWKPAWQKVVLAGLVSGVIAAVFYAPFWLGHSVHDIAYSFLAPPSAQLSENSIMRSVHDWIKAHGLPTQTSWLHTPLSLLDHRRVWDKINYIFLAGTLMIGAIWLWRVPTTRTMALAAVLSLGVLLLVTPWFFPWYAIWLVSLAVVCLPTSIDRLGRALIAFTLTFSVCAFIPYANAVGRWVGYFWLAMAIPPVLVFLVFLALKKTTHARLVSDADSDTISV